MRDGKALGEAKKAKLTVAQRVGRQKKIFGTMRLIGFVVGTALFVVTALVVIGLGLPAWLVWIWTFVFWVKWQHKIATSAKVYRSRWAAALQK